MKKFTGICQRYTDVMAHKYYLQDILFTKTIDATLRKQLTSVIIKLQVMGFYLEKAQVYIRMLYASTHALLNVYAL